MSVNLDNVNGMGATTFPQNGNFGSGDIPYSLNTIYTYSDFIKNFIYTDESDEDKIVENSMNDKIKGTSNNKKGLKLSSFIRDERLKFKTWYDTRHINYITALSNEDDIEKKKNLKIEFMSDVKLKKKEMSDKIKQKRLQLSSQEV